MAEVIGIVAAAIAFAQATATILDGINKFKDAPKNIQELHYELQDFEKVLLQIDNNLSCQQGDPTETVLRSCSDMLKQLHDLVAPFQQDEEYKKLRKYVNGLRIRLKESEIENAVKRLQSQKLTLTLALIGSIFRGSDKAFLTTSVTHKRYNMLRLQSQIPGENGTNGWDMKMLTRIIDQRMTVAAQQLRCEPNSKIEDLLGVDEAQFSDLWKLDFESVRNLKGAVDEKKREQFLESLCTPDYQQDRVRIKDASNTTCEWIWHHDAYTSFRTHTKSRILHVCGKAGSGKSVLAKHVWKRLSNELAESPGNDYSALLYYYCDRRTRPDERASSILRALIHQFLWQTPSLFSTVVQRSELIQSRSFSGGRTSWTFESLWYVFRDIVINSRDQVIYCIIDALDECENDSMERFLSSLTNLLDQETNGVIVKFFLTSRIEGHIINSLEGHAISITVHSTVTRPDIATYVGERLVGLRKKLRLDAAEEQNLRQLLGDRGDGMFLWAELAIKELEKARGVRAKTVANRVRLLPSGLNALYERMLTKIDEMCEDQDTIGLVRKILTWVTLAARPLALAELRTALAIELDTKCVASVEPFRNISDDLLSLCGSFIEIVRTNNEAAGAEGGLPALEGQIENEGNEENDDMTATVRLIHQSAKEYLVDSTALNGSLSKFRIDSQTANGEIAKTCLTYLLFRDFESGLVREGNTNNPENAEPAALLRQKLENYEFLDYAALHWPTHVREGRGEDMYMSVCKFLNDFPGQFQSWCQIAEFIRGTEVNHNPSFTGVHVASRWGLDGVLRLLLDQGAEVEAKDTDNRTALHYAAGYGHLEVIKLLLDRGVEIEAKDNMSWTVLHYATRFGYLEVIKLLLDRGAEIEAKNADNSTALHLTAAYGHLEVMKLLLDRGAEIEAKIEARDVSNGTALYVAAGNGHLEVVKLLLDRGAKIEAKDIKSWTVLHYATRYGCLEVIKLLLDRGAEIEAKDADNSTGLHLAAGNGHLEVVKLLLDRGAEIEVKTKAEDVDNWTILHVAAENGYLEMVKLLLDRGADIEAKDVKNNTALHLAAGNGLLEVVKLLLDRGAEIEAKIKAEDVDNWTALHVAAGNGYLEVVKLLLDRGAEIEAKIEARGVSNGTALHVAAENGHLEVVKLLLDQGLEIEAKDTNNWTALYYAAQHGHLEVTKLLLNQGAEIKAKNYENGSALHLAAVNGYLEVVKLLLNQGAEIEAKDIDNWTALHYAARYRHLEVVKLLVDRGAEIEAKNVNNWTALHYAARYGQVEVAKLLLDRGTEIVGEEIDNGTALCDASEWGHDAIVLLLLGRGVNPNSRDYGTILQAASYNGNEVLVQLLLERSADINVQSDGYGEALQLGCIKGNVAVVDNLMHAGADPNTVDEHGWTSLLCASKFQQDIVMERLLASGGDPSLAVRNSTLPPTLWSVTDKSSHLTLDEDALTIRYASTEDKGIATPAAARANHPIPLQNTGFYFEITILDSGETGIIGLGLCGGFTSLDAMPGWNASSWGYHGDDGKLFESSGTGKSYGDVFGTGDVVGCYITFDKGIAFTKNGTSLGTAIKGIVGKLYPVVGMQSRGACIRVNFGHERFLYDVSLVSEGLPPGSEENYHD